MTSTTHGRTKAVFFDLDDTLVLTNDADVKAYEAVRRLAQESEPKVDCEQLINDWMVEFVTSPWDPEHKVDVNQWRAGLWFKALRRQGIGDEDLGAALQHCFATTRLSLFRFEDGVKDMVARLRAAGIAAVIITNGHHEVQRQKLEACGAEGLFDGMIVGGDEVRAGRREKPAPEIFHSACRLANCQPCEAVHIGDSLLADVAGGINAGLAATVWVNRDGRAPPPSAPLPDFTVAHVTELPRVLEALQRRGEGS